MNSTLSIEGPRACKKDELPKLISMVDSVFRQGTDQSVLTDYPLVYHDQNLENIQIIKVNKEIAAVVPFIPHTVVLDKCQFKIAIISPTATSPEHRKKGYALRCLNSCIERMNMIGCDLSILWTLVQTFPFYEKENYQGVGNQGWLYNLNSQDTNKFNNNGEIILEYDGKSRKYLDSIQSIHEKEIYGVQRTKEEYPYLFSLPKIKTLLACINNKTVGYLMVSSAVNKPGLIEAGGTASAVETLLNRVLKESSNNKSLSAYSYLTPSILGHVLESKVPEKKQAVIEGPMMVRINNIPGFLKKISTWLIKKNSNRNMKFSIYISDSGELISFNFNNKRLQLGHRKMDEHIELTRREFTSIIFGPHLERPVITPNIMKEMFPIYFPIWILDHS